MDEETFSLGPYAYITREYPLVAGRLNDQDALAVKVYGLSSAGGDLKNDANFRNRSDGRDWVAVYGESLQKNMI